MFELTKIQTIKIYTYKYTLYILIKLNLITINYKNYLLSKYLDKLINSNKIHNRKQNSQSWTLRIGAILVMYKYQLNKLHTFTN